MKKLFSFITFSYCAILMAQPKIDPNSIRPKMQWFADAKLGIFIHAGIYAVDGVDESWSFYNKKISHENYMKQLKGFDFKKYDPSFWADLIQKSGAKYAVITTKHHDGVALYNTKQNNLSTVKATPSKKDIISPFFAELRKRNIKCGAYFSLIDWSHPDYPAFTKDSTRYKTAENPQKWAKFQKFFQAQINEVSTLFNPDLFWFDGDWEHSADEWQSEKVRSQILTHNPNAIINGRLQGYGDYATPEQNFPISRPPMDWWELCMTTNNNWGFQHTDLNWKTPHEIITIFVDAVANGGNLLLDMGPKADGTIPQEQINVLQELGNWNQKNGEAIFGTLPGIPQGHFYGPTTLSKDNKTLYLFVHGQTSGQLLLKGLYNKITNIEVLGNNTKLSHKIVGKISWSDVPGLVYINLPNNLQDKYVTAIKVELDSPIKLYKGQGGFN